MVMPYDHIMDENDEIKMKKYINRGKKILRYAKSLINSEEYCNYHQVFCDLEMKLKISMKNLEVMDTRPIIGIPGIPTIEKILNFNDSVSTEKQNWYMS